MRPFGVFEIQVVAEYQNIGGGPFEDIQNFKKLYHSAETFETKDLLVSSGFPNARKRFLAEAGNSNPPPLGFP